MIGRIILGFVVAIAGFVLVWKSEWFQQNFGSIQWAEEKFGTSGGSRLMYKLIGLVFLFAGFLIVTDLHRKVLVAILGSIFPGITPPEEGLE